MLVAHCILALIVFLQLAKQVGSLHGYTMWAQEVVENNGCRVEWTTAEVTRLHAHIPGLMALSNASSQIAERMASLSIFVPHLITTFSNYSYYQLVASVGYYC